MSVPGFAFFEYGLTSDLGSSTTPQAVPKGNAFVHITENLTGLYDSATYYYRLAYQTALGTVRGSIVTVATPTCGGGGCDTGTPGPYGNCAAVPAPPETPSDLGSDTSVSMGSLQPSTGVANDASLGIVDPGIYSFEYVSGALNIILNCGFDANNYDAYYLESDPFGSGLGYWVVAVSDCTGGTSDVPVLDPFICCASFGYIADVSGAPPGCNPVSLATFVATVKADDNVQNLTPPCPVQHYGGELKLHFEPTISGGGAGAADPTFDVTLVKTDTVTPPNQLYVSAGEFPDLEACLFHYDAVPATGGEIAWDGSFPNFCRGLLFSSWEWDADTNLKVNEQELNATFTYIQHNCFPVLPTPSGCWWILTVLVNGNSGGLYLWTGYGGNGADAVGTYYFSPELSSFEMTADQLADVDVATVISLPCNTQVGLTLVADNVGALGNIDGVSPIVNDRILVKNEFFPSKNGVYTITSLGSAGTPWVLTRATDWDADAETLQGKFVKVTAGTENEGCYYRMVTPSVVVGTTDQDWVKIPASITVTS